MKPYQIHLTFKRKFIAGLFVTIPIAITLLLISWIFKFIDGILAPFLEMLLGKHIPGIGFVSAVLLVFVVGIVSTNMFGKKILKFLERALLHIPVFKSLYSSIKQLVDAFSPEGQKSFKKFVIVKHPMEGSYAFGFLTQECEVTVPSSKTMQMKTVYIPTNNLYLGEVVLVQSDMVIYTDIAIDDGIKIILSGGLATPPNITGKTELTN